jgi:hypothetical protein
MKKNLFIHLFFAWALQAAQNQNCSLGAFPLDLTHFRWNHNRQRSQARALVWRDKLKSQRAQQKSKDLLITSIFDMSSIKTPGWKQPLICSKWTFSSRRLGGRFEIISFAFTKQGRSRFGAIQFRTTSSCCFEESLINGWSWDEHAFLRGRPIAVKSEPFGRPRFLVTAGRAIWERGNFCDSRVSADDLELTDDLCGDIWFEVTKKKNKRNERSKQ